MLVSTLLEILAVALQRVKSASKEVFVSTLLEILDRFMCGRVAVAVSHVSTLLEILDVVFPVPGCPVNSVSTLLEILAKSNST